VAVSGAALMIWLLDRRWAIWAVAGLSRWRAGSVAPRAPMKVIVYCWRWSVAAGADPWRLALIRGGWRRAADDLVTGSSVGYLGGCGGIEKG
jgi:hypothetical protein